jgi:aminoglycoside phosphotransferase (APT) family kinase protein
MSPLWSPEQEISIEKASQLIKIQFPQLKPARLKVLGEGFDNSVFLVNDQFVFRFPRRQMAVELIETEVRLLPVLAPLLPIPTPNPQFRGKPDNDYPWPFAGYNVISGQAPSKLTNEQRILSAKPLAQFLRVLHDFPVVEAEKRKIPYDTMGRVDVKKRKTMIEENMKKASEMNLIDQHESELLQQFLQTVHTELSDNTLVLAHGDLHFRNLLVDDSGKISGVIDWGDTHIGSPAVDLSIIYQFLPPEGRRFFFDIYGEVNDSIKIMAKVKAIHTALLLLLYGHDLNDEDLVRESRAAVKLACRF